MTADAKISPPKADNHDDVSDPTDATYPDSATSLTVSHLWLADAIARRFQGRGQDLDDLRQVARCGLLEAARRYDADKGAFGPYATSTISGVLKRHLRDHAWTVRPPRRTQQIALQITREWSDVAQDGRRHPTDSAFAEIIGESVADIREARSAAQGYHAVSIEAEVLPATATSACDPGYERSEAQILVAQAWRQLDPAERDLLRMRFWEYRSQAEIAQQIGVSQMQVSRLLSRVLTKIRRLLDIDIVRASA
jgi:RNA polymerase sigma-B factor